MKPACEGRTGWVVAWLCLLGALLAGCGKQDAAPEPRPEPEPQVDRKPDKGADLLAKARERSTANLKQIAAAFGKYEEVYKSYPIGLIDHKSGQLGLSWRVQILPHLEDMAATELYKQFHLDEPWDSDHNKKLLEKMPQVYAPVRGEAPPGHTFYQGFADHYVKADGKDLGPRIFGGPTSLGAFFPDPRTYHPPGKPPRGTALAMPGRRIAHIADGTLHTFLVVEAGEAVPWSKPQDIPFRFDLDNALQKGQVPWLTGTWPKLGGMFDGDFHAVMVAGTVHYIKKDAPVEKLRPFITFADGTVPDFPGIGLEAPEYLKERQRKNSPKGGETKGK